MSVTVQIGDDFLPLPPCHDFEEAARMLEWLRKRCVALVGLPKITVIKTSYTLEGILQRQQCTALVRRDPPEEVRL